MIVLRNELKYEESKVKVTLVCPGWIDTDIRDRHLVETQQKYVKSKLLSVEDAVNGTLDAIAKGEREKKFTFLHRIQPLIGYLFPNKLDSIAIKSVFNKSSASEIKSKI